MSGWGSIYNNTQASLRSQLQNLVRLQEQVATGSRILRPSDDPGDAYRVLQLRDEISSLETYKDNLASVSLNYKEASNALEETSDALARVSTLITQAANGTYDQDNRNAIADEVDALLEQTLSLANYKSLGRYIFGGASVGTAPYTAARENGQIISVSYAGSDQELPIPVAPGVEYSGVLVGEKLFTGDSRRAPEFHGDTGLVAGSGTSTVRGDVWLSLEHLNTTFDDGGAGSGIAAGTSSADADTILGNHQVFLDADNQRIRLDDGAWTDYDGTETDLALTNVAGDRLHVDLTDPGMGALAGTVTVNVQATARASIDDGLSTTDITTFADNVAVADAASGRVLYLDTTDLQRTGTEPIRVPGTYNLFETLIEVRDLMRNTRQLDPEEQTNRLLATLDSVEEVSGGIRHKLTSVGGRLGAMTTLEGTLENIQANAEDEATDIESADIAELSANIARTQTLYQMTLATASKILNLSLVDYLR